MINDYTLHRQPPRLPRHAACNTRSFRRAAPPRPGPFGPSPTPTTAMVSMWQPLFDPGVHFSGLDVTGPYYETLLLEDSKSVARKSVRVQLPPRVPNRTATVDPAEERPCVFDFWSP